MTLSNKLSNGDSREFWNAAHDNGKLVFQKCAHCGTVQFPPRHQCAECWNDDLSWIESSGRGVIESITVVRRSPLAEFRERVPYAVVAVAVEEGPRMITSLVGDGALDAGIGDRVTVTFEERTPETTLPQFQLAS